MRAAEPGSPIPHPRLQTARRHAGRTNGVLRASARTFNLTCSPPCSSMQLLSTRCSSSRRIENPMAPAARSRSVPNEAATSRSGSLHASLRAAGRREVAPRKDPANRLDSDGPGRDRTCELGIKSPAGTAEASCESAKVTATARVSLCDKQQRIAASGDEPVLPGVLPSVASSCKSSLETRDYALAFVK